MNPTVSDIKTGLRDSTGRARTVGSRVAKRREEVSTVEEVRVLKSVDFPALV
jgi:hypothetical protein